MPEVWSHYRKPAYAIDNVAEPAPFFAFTTSSPPNWTPVYYISIKVCPAVKKKRTVNKGIKLLFWDFNSRLCLTEERHNSLAGVTTNDWNGRFSRVFRAGDGLYESLGADYIQRRDTEQTLRIEDVGVFQHLSGNGHSGVDRVGNDQDEGLRAELGNSLDQVAHDARVDLEQIIAGHAGLPCYLSTTLPVL